jgi:hypothetical protein
MASWSVKLFLVEDPPLGMAMSSTTKPTEAPGFGVTADGVDGALAAARVWLTERGHTVRSVSVCVPADARQLSAVATKKKEI